MIIKIISYNNYQELLQALINKEVDAIYNDHIHRLKPNRHAIGYRRTDKSISYKEEYEKYNSINNKVL